MYATGRDISNSTKYTIYVFEQHQQTMPYTKFCYSVCMNTYILENIRARDAKLGDNLSYCWTQIQNDLEFSHTPLCLY